MDFKKELTEIMLKKELCSIFATDDLEGGYTGFLLNVTDDEILMLKINRDGREDGYYLRRTADIVYWITDDDDLHRRQKLWKKDESRLCSPLEGKDLSTEFLSYAMEKEALLYVSNSEEDSYTVGWVKDFSDDVLVLEECLLNGESDGTTCLKREFLDEMEVASQELEVRKTFWTSKIPEPEPASPKSLFKILKKYEGKSQLLGFFRVGEDDAYCVGNVEYVTEDEVLVHDVLITGEYNGHILLPLNEVSNIFYDDRVIQKRSRLLQKTEPENPLFLAGNSLFDELLSYAQDSDSLIYIELDEDTYFRGKVLSWDNEILFLSRIDSFGKNEGQLWFRRDYINAIQIESYSLKAIESLIR